MLSIILNEKVSVMDDAIYFFRVYTEHGIYGSSRNVFEIQFYLENFLILN